MPQNPPRPPLAIVHILRKETGEVQSMEDEFVFKDDPGAPAVFIWAEGNWSCDCNRELFFFRNKGVELDEDDDACAEGRYAVKIVDPRDGRVVHSDHGFDEFDRAAAEARDIGEATPEPAADSTPPGKRAPRV